MHPHLPLNIQKPKSQLIHPSTHCFTTWVFITVPFQRCPCSVSVDLHQWSYVVRCLRSSLPSSFSGHLRMCWVSANLLRLQWKVCKETRFSKHRLTQSKKKTKDKQTNKNSLPTQLIVILMSISNSIHPWPNEVWVGWLCCCPSIVWKPIRSSHATYQGTLSHSCLHSLSHCGL